MYGFLAKKVFILLLQSSEPKNQLKTYYSLQIKVNIGCQVFCKSKENKKKKLSGKNFNFLAFRVESSQAEKPSARAMARASLARTHH